MWLQEVGPLPGDRWALRFPLWPARPLPWRNLIELFNVLGSPIIAFVVVAIAAYLLIRGGLRRSGWYVVVASLAVVPNAIVKAISGPTPLWSATHADQTANFPSGHAAFIVGLAGSLAIVAWQHRRRDLVLLACVAIAWMGPSRVFLGAHLPSDVVAGYLMGLAWLTVATVLLQPRRTTGDGSPDHRSDA